MTDSDYFAFSALIRRVAALFRVRCDTEDFKATTQSYFQALKKIQLADLERAADAWIERETKFPKPVEWRMAIPRHAVELQPMSDTDAREYARAESRWWTDDPCNCRDCVAAGVNEKPLRFVPDFDDNGVEIRRRDPIGDRVVITGHWAHGWELFRTCEAEGVFWAIYYANGGPSKKAQISEARLSFRERMAQIFPEKQTRGKSDLESLTDR